MRKIITAVLVLAALALTGCGSEKATEKAIEKAMGVTVDEKKNTVTLQGQNGEKVTVTTETAGKLPDGFPLPVYPQGKVKTGGKIDVGGKAMYTVELTYKGEAKPAVDYYEKAIKDKGMGQVFRAESSSDDEEQWTLSGESDKAAVAIFFTANKKTKEALVAISWTEK